MVNGSTFSVCFAALIAAVAAFGQSISSATSLPPVGLASSETAQVNVVNTAPGSSSGSSGSCTVSIVFYDASGAAIASESILMESGKIASAKLPYASAGATGTARILVRARVSASTIINPYSPGNGGTPTSPPPCVIASSLETYDTESGVTHVFYSGGAQVPVFVNPAGR